MAVLITFLSSFALGLLGLLIYFTVKALYYIRTGKFSFTLWKKENLVKFVYSIILLFLLLLLFTLSPESKEFLLGILGIDLNLDSNVYKNLAPEILGAALGSFVCRAKKEVKEEKKIAENGKE